MERFLTYWRTSLADEDLVSRHNTDDMAPVPADDVVRAGRLPPKAAAKLRRDWQAICDSGKGDRTSAEHNRPPDSQVVPLVVLLRGLVAVHTHGAHHAAKSAGPHFPLIVPALLLGDDTLVPARDTTPWIGRQFLAPVEHLERPLPVVGEIAAFDTWLDHHVTPPADWPALMAHCDDMWQAVTDGNLPDGYTAAKDCRIGLGPTTRDMAAQIRRVYDALIDASEMPPLLRRLCEGTQPRVIGDEGRVAGFTAPRGTMSAQYGLAPNQALAVVATADLQDGHLLAVNGPPGTGKTTLLQAIIATKVVERALAGSDPAIIVAVSTNNQAVQNINEAMNSVLAADRVGDEVSWARRWVPDVPTYGLYLPAGSKVEEAAKKGYAYAVKRNSDWQGFPERELDPEFVDNAERTWLSAFSDTYGIRTTVLDEAAVETIRQDLLQIQARVEAYQAPVGRWFTEFEWWRSIEGRATPEEHIATVRSNGAALEARLVTDIENRRSELARLRAERDAALAPVKADLLAAADTLTAAAARLDQAAELRLRLANAGAARGPLEIMADVVPFWRERVAARQHERLFSALADEERPAFRALFLVRDRAAWFRRADEIVAECQKNWTLSRQSHDTADMAMRQASEPWASRVFQAEHDVGAAEAALMTAREALTEELARLTHRLDQLVAAAEDLAGCYADVAAVARELGATIPDISTADAARTDWLNPLDAAMDVSVRYEMFQKAMRYWEGRWILEARRLCADVKLARKNGHDWALGRFRRWSMLTPCLISTLHALPKAMRYSAHIGNDGGKPQYASDYLLSGIDLLIMDESGQVAPHVGAAAFALAKTAITVGDIYQIEPVVTLSAGTDRANAIRCDLGTLWDEASPTTPHFLTEAEDGFQGSIMRMAQRATSLTVADAGAEAGVFLSEHRRCANEVIAYCNDLVYSGRLRPLAAAAPPAPSLNRWGWAHVRGPVVRRNGSQANEAEARAIAEWIAGRAVGEDGWLAHYAARDARYDSLATIVAVVTPFSAQAKAIRDALAAKGLAGITVGTVHALQGAERPIIVFSPTVAVGAHPPFFDRKPNMLNVAVSRARDHFVVIGDMRLFRADGRRTPSSVLAPHLFRDAGNEIPDVPAHLALPKAALAVAEHIATLQGHRAALAGAFQSAQRGDRVVVISPYVSKRAIEADDLPALCQRATSAGAEIHLVVDKVELTTDPRRRSSEALDMLESAGARIHRVPAIHDKVLIVADREIVQGSFNWLAAARDPALRGVRHESSVRLRGDYATDLISRTLKDWADQGVRL